MRARVGARKQCRYSAPADDNVLGVIIQGFRYEKKVTGHSSSPHYQFECKDIPDCHILHLGSCWALVFIQDSKQYGVYTSPAREETRDMLPLAEQWECPNPRAARGLGMDENIIGTVEAIMAPSLPPGYELGTRGLPLLGRGPCAKVWSATCEGTQVVE